MTRNPYNILNVKAGADEQEIKSAFRRLVREFHPDINPGNARAEEIFREVTDAYGLLLDPKKRAQVDRMMWLRMPIEKVEKAKEKATSFAKVLKDQMKSAVDIFPEKIIQEKKHRQKMKEFQEGVSQGLFTVQDNGDVFLDLALDLKEAVFGDRVDVPTFEGRVALRIPENSNSGDLLRLRGRGLYNKKSKKKGDQYVRLKVVLPTEPDESLKDFLKSWSREYKVRED